MKKFQKTKSLFTVDHCSKMVMRGDLVNYRVIQLIRKRLIHNLNNKELKDRDIINVSHPCFMQNGSCQTILISFSERIISVDDKAAA